MLNVTSEEFSKALSERVIAARGEVMQKRHTLSEAEYGRDALAKVNIIYLFIYLVTERELGFFKIISHTDVMYGVYFIIFVCFAAYHILRQLPC
jgi:hypothetical protein